MSLRRKSREYALQMLFQWDMGKQEPAKIEAGFWKNAKAQESTRKFANELFENAAARTAELDPIISQHAQNWRIERMAAIDRAILRLALCEIRNTSTPSKVIINEALELAKKFSTEEASPFINGVLDAATKSATEKAPAVPPSAPEEN
jgi:transcription antitermination protein NusB